MSKYAITDPITDDQLLLVRSDEHDAIITAVTHLMTTFGFADLGEFLARSPDNWLNISMSYDAVGPRNDELGSQTRTISISE